MHDFLRIGMVACLAALVLAADAPATPAPAATKPAVKPAAKPAGGKTAATPAKRLSALDLVAEDEKWLFRPTAGRIDPFLDLEAQLMALKQSKSQKTETKRPTTTKAGQAPQPNSDIEQLVQWGKGEEARVRQLVVSRKYEDAMKAAEGPLKQLEPHIARPDVAAVVVAIRTYRAQAEEAKIRDDAQAAFEGLKIRVLGVLWSQDGARLAIIDGETKALTVNDRFKECVLINIDQDRVDFRYHFGRRRFEFPVYVDQQSSRSKP